MYDYCLIITGRKVGMKYVLKLLKIGLITILLRLFLSCKITMMKYIKVHLYLYLL